MSDEHEKKRALVLIGAGASVELGIPATIGLGELIDDAIRADAFCTSQGGTEAYFDIQNKLGEFYGSVAEAHFERIYHVMHELSQLHLIEGSVPKFRPVMFPFLTTGMPYSGSALRAACGTVRDFIYSKVSEICDSPARPLKSLSDFFQALERRYIPRVYTTNYDNFVTQATHGRYFTGFERQHGDHLDFDGKAFWSEWSKPSLFHLHGSIHMGFPLPREHDIGDIAWFDDKTIAKRYSGFTGSGVDRMDGTHVERGAIITGLDKLGRLQQQPFSFYYSGLSRDSMQSDLVLVLGSGLADLHVNNCLKAARRSRPEIPILYVGWWGAKPCDFYSATQYEQDDRDIALLHELGIDVFNIRERSFRECDGWTVDAKGNAAVWADGFQSFLSAPEAFEKVIQRLTSD